MSQQAFAERQLRVPYLSLLLTLATVILFTVAPFSQTNTPNPNSLFWLGVLNQDQPTELWRVMTAHWLHTDLNHLLWNAAALLLIGSIVEQRSRGLLLCALIGGMCSVGAWFYWQTGSTYYCGWSGALNTVLLVALATLYWPASTLPSANRHYYNSLLWLVAFGALAKNLYEYSSGVALVSETLWQPAPAAHMAGWTAGVLLVAGFWLWYRMRSARD